MCIFLIRRKQSFSGSSGTGCRSCEKTNAVPQRRNGRDYSPGFCSVPIVGISCTATCKALTASKTTMYAPATKAVEAPVLPTISGKMYWGTGDGAHPCGQCLYSAGRGEGFSKRNGCNAAAPIRNATSEKIEASGAGQETAG